MIVTVAFGKGGTGKTTTAAALVNYARMKGKSVLAIDCDPQANFTYALGGDATKPGLFSVLTNQTPVTDVTQETPQTFLVSAGLNLAAAEQAIANKPGRDFILRDALKDVRDRYDLIVIDTQPDLNCLLINALSVSDTVILPMQANSFSIMGLYQMQETISQVQRYCNPELTIAGIVLTKFKSRQTLANDLRESIVEQAQQMNTKVFDTYIREGVAVEQSQAMQTSLFDYAPSCNPAIDYKQLFAEANLI
jgi:chromosome partitioning protein